MKRRLHDRLRQEAGWTLIELLVGMAIFTFVLGAALSLFEVGVRSAPKEQERAAAITEAQTGLSGMVREIRDANEIIALTPNIVDFVVLRQGVQTHVRYECGVTDTTVTPSLLKCQRSQGTVAAVMPALGTPVTVVARMLNGTAGDPVMTYTLPPVDPVDPEDDPLDAAEPPTITWPTYIDFKVKVPAKGNLNDTRAGSYRHTISFSDAAYLRNLEARQSPYNTGG